MVDKDAGEILSDGAVEKYCGNRRIHTAAEAENNAVAAELFFQLRHCGIDERLRTPRTRGATDADCEVLKQLHAASGVEYLGVELHAPHLRACLESSQMDIGSRCHAVERRRDGCYRVAMTHPHLGAFFDFVEQRAGMVDICEIGAAVFSRRSRLDRSAECECHELRAVADAEHRHHGVDAGYVHFESVLVVDRQRAAREDNTDNTLLGFTTERILVIRNDFAINAQLAHTTADKLCRLRAEVEDYNLFLHRKRVGIWCRKVTNYRRNMQAVGRRDSTQIQRNVTMRLYTKLASVYTTFPTRVAIPYPEMTIPRTAKLLCPMILLAVMAHTTQSWSR